MVLLNVLVSGVDRFDTVFQWAIAFNSPVSVICGVGGGGEGGGWGWSPGI